MDAMNEPNPPPGGPLPFEPVPAGLDAPPPGVEPEPPAAADEAASSDIATPAPAPALELVMAASAPRAGRNRWVVGGVVAVAVVALAVWAATILGARPLPEVLRYIPTDSAIVVELRPELPGDQRQHLGNFLAHFPGFADQSTLSKKIDEALARIITNASNGIVDYTTQVKPLLAGPMAAAMSAADLSDLGGGRMPSDLLIVATTDGKATCSIFKQPVTKLETYRGVELERLNVTTPACAMDGRFMLVGTADAIKHGLDAHLDGKGIDANSTFRSAREQLSGDQVALAYLDGKSVTSTLETLAPSLGLDTALGASVPDWAIAGLRVVDDALQLETRSAPVAAPALESGTPTDPPSAKSAFAGQLPADAFGFVEVHGVGANLQRGLARLRTDPATSAVVDQIEQALGAVGGVQNVAAWMEDLAAAGIPLNDSAGAIVLIRGTDATATAARLSQIRNLLVLAGTGSDLTVRDSDHNGVAITTVDLGDLDTLLPSLGMPAGSLGSGGGRLAFSLAARDDVLMIGLGDGVIEHVLDVPSGSSLASNPTYTRAIELAGTPNDIEAFIAIDSIVGWAEAHLIGADAKASFEQDVKPYLEHLAGLAEASESTTTGALARIVLTVK